MSDSAFTIFIIFGLIWVLMGVIAVIALVKSEGQEVRFDKSGIIVFVPIILSIIFVLLYQFFRPFFL